MFFTNELLDKRESGFGLLWLAATLGSKSTFKKLPRRSVLTADIPGLCILISEPAEPMALRLSSNLMIGVARVYKVKQEMLMTDVTACSNSLKKVVQEFRSTAAVDAQLQMAQPNLKASALTLAGRPDGAFVMNFDDLVADWDEYLDLGGNSDQLVVLVDDDFDPKSKKAKQQKKKAKSATPFEAEDGRADPHVLNEQHHDHFLNNSLDLSMNNDFAGGVSSSQVGGGFDGFDLGGEEIDLGLGGVGEGWGLTPEQDTNAMELSLPGNDDFNVDMNGGDFDYGHMDFSMGDDLPMGEFELDGGDGTKKKRRAANKVVSDKENLPPSSISAQSLNSQQAADASFAGPKSPLPFSQQLMSQDEAFPGGTPTPSGSANAKAKPTKRPAKRPRLLQDAKIELTDAELKAGRADYLESQTALKRQIAQNQLEKESGKLTEELIWGPPKSLRAPVLIAFWNKKYKAQVEARMGKIHGETPQAKRYKKGLPSAEEGEDSKQNQFNAELDMGMDYDGGMDIDMAGGGFEDQPPFNDEQDRVRSSEEPGQARDASRPVSELGSRFDFRAGSLGLDAPENSQRSSIFPWDQAGGGSSSAVGVFGQASEVSADRAEVKIRRGSSVPGSRRGSSLDRSQPVSGRAAFSPGSKVQLDGEDFEFDVPDAPAELPESQQSEANLVNLERNSFNFLEYARMQSQTLPDNVPSLTFDHIVPHATSTRHVAASAFYHCLVLGTKDLLRLTQPEAYGTLSLAVI